MELNQSIGVIKMNDILKEIKNTIKQDKVVVAVSGGPDSMCLLYLIKKVSSNVIVAHVNHNLRKESKEEEKMVQDYCNKNNIIFETTKIKTYIGNTENYARKKRYEFFEKIIEKYDAKYLLTAHHGDDLIETVLMRLIKGLDIEKLVAFKDKTKRDNYTLYRPLISKTKDEILLYCKKNEIPYKIDETNLQDTYTRNRIRKYILPHLKEENSQIHKNFLKFSRSLDEIEKYVEKDVKKIKVDIYKNNKIDIEQFKKHSLLIKKKIVYSILKENYREKIILIKEKNVDDILKMIDSLKPNQKVDLPLNKEFVKSYNEVYIQTKKENNRFNYILKDEIKLHTNHIIKVVESSKDTSNYTLKISSKDVSLPLHVRSRQNGDKIEVKGLNGTKKVKDILIDEKVPKEKRNNVPIVTDDRGIILWIPGIKKSKFDVSNSKNYDIIIRYF